MKHYHKSRKTAICLLLAVVIALLCSCQTNRDRYSKEIERPDKYYYNQLDEEQKNFYNHLYSMEIGAEYISITLKESLTFESQTNEPDDAEKQELMDEIKRISQGAIDAFSTDNPEIFWIDFSKSYTNVEFCGKRNKNGYKWTVSEIKFYICIKEQFKDDLHGAIEKLNDIINSFTPDGNSTYEKVKYIHDHICKINTSDSSAENQYSIYGALVDGRSVCQGYAQAFKALCDKSGITCICIVGTAQEENHMWNYVMMDDGKWYAVDTTWDDRDPIRYTYFLVGKETIIDSDTDKTFDETHISTGDISRTEMIDFVLPELSADAFLQSFS